MISRPYFPKNKKHWDRNQEEIKGRQSPLFKHKRDGKIEEENGETSSQEILEVSETLFHPTSSETISVTYSSSKSSFVGTVVDLFVRFIVIIFKHHITRRNASKSYGRNADFNLGSTSTLSVQRNERPLELFRGKN